uniref:EF-P arginine 32 rhamnosyl-transferase, ALA-ALA-GLY-ALA-ALA-GLY-ALA-ALA-ALA-ALA-ALA-ALA, transferase n=1 Tax=Microviridae sp. ct79Q5 TaxID=2826727 RepID=A0A8S5NSK9_9VIRU|nr:MAG TPA: EF-P arginine 32 rhamnosyl-transferase, ALA-ALA-GLY-ALA-ALA-GLY-ALA-ALA-ALA-ALA-ALA-ALA, transferase [Microviridae sp. ct79Q5]
MVKWFFFPGISTICARVHPRNSYILDVTVSGDTPMTVRVPNALLGCLLSL